MFSKKVHVDVKKSTLKIQDSKKDSATRLKHLKIVIDNVETEEAKNFFESNFSHIYFVLYESFVAAEANLRQRELSFHLVHKAHREELECVLLVLERVLLLLPELLARRWQSHSLSRIMAKLLHPANSWKLRREAIRLFLLWYQALGEFAPDLLHVMFATLVPGFPSPVPGEGLHALLKNTSSGTVFHDTNYGPVMPVELLPLLPPQSGEKQPDEPTRFFLDILLENMVSQVTRLEWRDRFSKQQKCFTFLFERFKQYYLPHIFPKFSHATNLYKPVLDFPEVRKPTPTLVDTVDGKKKQDPFIICRVAVIKWVSSFTQLTRRGETPSLHTHSSLTPSEDESGMELRRVSVSQAMSAPHDGSIVSHDSTSQPPSLLSQTSQGSQHDTNFHYTSEDPSTAAMLLVRDVLYGSRDNVNFIHEVYRQAFLLNFTHSPAIRRAIAVYKDWIQMNVPEIPSFILEPIEGFKEDQFLHSSGYRSGPPSSEYTSIDGSDSDTGRMGRLRNDSYIGAIQRDSLVVRAGMQNVLQMFITNAANVFLLEVSGEYPLLLEEQVDTCKRVLNIYRYMVMHTRMEPRTWEQLLLILLRITSLILSKTPPRRKEDTLGGKLAPAIFQTLIVTWIKANLNVVISIELWDRFLQVLSSLTQWEELIREWAKTLDTLTRVLARHVYGLDLNDLPLDRLTEQKVKKRRGGRPGPTPEHRPSLANIQDPSGSTGAARTAVQPQLPPPTVPTLMHEGSDTSYPSPESSGNFRHVSPRKRHGSSGENSRLGSPRLPLGRAPLKCSSSESGLATIRRTRVGRDHRSSNHHSHPPNAGNTVVIPVLPASLEKEVDRLIASPHHFSGRLLRKSHSLDSLRTYREGTPHQYSESEGPTRTPSPAPSSGVESNSIKDSPMQIDVISSDGTSLDLSDSCERRSVMAGGTVRGWLPDVAVVLWRRMLCALGDVNRLPDPNLHAQVFEYLVELSHTLLKLRQNQAVSVDNLNTPAPPDLIPPLGIIAPWCFKALALPADYHKGQLCAYQLLCNITLAPQDLQPSKDHIVEFYRALHQGLTGTDQSVINTLVRHCGSRFFSLMLPGFSLLIFDFIQAANTIVCSSDLRGVPRTEATSILGALLSLSNTLQNMPVLNPIFNQYTVISPSDTKEQVLTVLLKSGRREPAGRARCVSICSLAIFLYDTLSRGSTHPKLRDAINVLLLALRFNHKTVAQVACEAVLLLVDHAPRLMELGPDIPLRIVEVLALTLQHLLVVEDTPLNEADRRLLTSLIFCLGEWCMRLPQECLLTPKDESCLLLTVFQVLNMVAMGDTSNPSEPLPPPDSDFDPNIRMDDLRESPWQGRRGSSMPPESQQSLQASLLPVRLAAKMVMTHLVNHLGHFPMAIGAARLSSLVVEHDDVPGLGSSQLSAEVFSAPNIQLFVMSSRLLVSLVELPALESPGGGVTAGLCTAPSQVRVILRDLGGKACWDASVLYCSPEDQPPSTQQHTQPEHGWCHSVSKQQVPAHEEMLLTSTFLGPSAAASPPQHALRHRPPDVLPSWENAADDMDNLDDLLQYIGHTSPECLPGLDGARNVPAPAPAALLPQAEEEAISTVLGQRLAERDFIQRHVTDTHMVAPLCVPVPPRLPDSPFQHCRLLFSQLGLAGWERRSQLHLLRKNDHLCRELRNLDSQRCRETHKIAVVYVAEGQEDKNSILSNTCGSLAYEEFIAGLAWEVELESHTGFLGGLQRNKSTGDTAPYFATSFLEVIFHVATRMPSSSQESLLQKTRHLGNDEVHIVWSEHSRDYRRGIIPTEFCDALIVIYPLPQRLYRVQVSRKPEVPFFGPLFDECIVEHRVLPGLVRATAIAASRAKRSMLPFYQNYYEERSKALETIVKSHKDSTTFEEFASQVYSPVQTMLPFYHPFSKVTGGHVSRSPEPGAGSFPVGVGGPVMRSNSTSSATSQSSAPSPHPSATSTLAAALIDSHHSSASPPVAHTGSPKQQDHRFRGPDGIRVWFSGSENSSASPPSPATSSTSSADPTAQGISPRPTKKLSFKTGAKKTMRADSVPVTPPDSPTNRKYR